MRLGVYALGLLLVVVGAVCVGAGSQIIRLEQGWTEVIAGSVVGSAGFVILVLGVMIGRLDALRVAITEWGVVERLHAPLRASDAPSLAPVWPAAEPAAEKAARDLPQAEPLQPELPLHLKPDTYSAAPLEVEPEPAFDRREPAVAEQRIEQAFEGDHRRQEIAPAIEPPSPPPPPVVELVETAVPERRSSRFISSILTRASALQRRKPFETAPPAASPVLPSLVPIEETVQPNAPPRTSVDLSSGWPDLVPETPQAPERPHEEPFVEAPVDPHADAAAESHGQETDQRDEEEEERREPEPVWEPEVAETAPVPPEATEPEPVAVMAEPHPLRPTIVGRYNAGSASYVMYSNGMIEVETATGTHQFESMQELKAFIERQDAGRV